MKETIINQCLDILKRDDVKRECKQFLKPIIELIFINISPYIYLIVSLVLIIFIMILEKLIILILILRNKILLNKVS